MRYLVTGADGFIGSHLVRELLRRSQHDQVVAFIHHRPARWLKPDPSDRLRIVDGDITRTSMVDRLDPVHAVIHLAGMSLPSLCDRYPDKARLVNFQGTVNLLNYALEHQQKPRFVFVSSAAVYGEPPHLPLTEETPPESYNQYSSTKLAAEMVVQAYLREQGVPAVIVRPFNIYGPRQKEDFVVPSILTQCLQGIELRLGDGRPIRNFTYVSDAVDLLIRAATVPRATGHVINLGTREAVSIADLARTIIELTGCDLEPIFDRGKFREDEPTILEMDPRLAEEVLGWRQQVTLEEGLRLTVEHERAKLEEMRGRAADALYGSG
jgi:nucleoside-diphosphate-sugar epimerase